MGSAKRIFIIFSLLLLIELINSQNYAVSQEEDLQHVKVDAIVEVSEGASGGGIEQNNNDILDPDDQTPEPDVEQNESTVTMESGEVNSRVDVSGLDIKNGGVCADCDCDCNCKTGVACEESATPIYHEDEAHDGTTPNPDEPSTDPEDPNEATMVNTEAPNTDEPVTTPEPVTTQAPVATQEPVTTQAPVATQEPTVTVTQPDPSVSTESSVAPCTEAGTFPQADDCHSYYTCSQTPSGNLERVDVTCPPKMAFNPEIGRCTRDIASCDDGVVCTVGGRFEDMHNNASYYWCVPRLFGGFHKYHVDCEAGKVFVPQLGRCFIDINNLQNLPPFFGQDDDQPDDEDIAKAEMKQFKAEEKAKLKQQKLKEKLEMKLKKELAKKAAKEAKEMEKNKNKSKEVA